MFHLTESCFLERGNLRDWIAFKENAPREIKSKSWGLSNIQDSLRERGVGFPGKPWGGGILETELGWDVRLMIKDVGRSIFFLP